MPKEKSLLTGIVTYCYKKQISNRFYGYNILTKNFAGGIVKKPDGEGGAAGSYYEQVRNVIEKEATVKLFDIF
jgi:hypothetical protein